MKRWICLVTILMLLLLVTSSISELENSEIVAEIVAKQHFADYLDNERDNPYYVEYCKHLIYPRFRKMNVNITH